MRHERDSVTKDGGRVRIYALEREEWAGRRVRLS